MKENKVEELENRISFLESLLRNQDDSLQKLWQLVFQIMKEK